MRNAGRTFRAVFLYRPTFRENSPVVLARLTSKLTTLVQANEDRFFGRNSKDCYKTLWTKDSVTVYSLTEYVAGWKAIIALLLLHAAAPSLMQRTRVHRPPLFHSPGTWKVGSLSPRLVGKVPYSDEAEMLPTL